MIFWRYTALFFSAIALLSLQKMPCLAPKSLSQNAKLILCPLLKKLICMKIPPLLCLMGLLAVGSLFHCKKQAVETSPSPNSTDDDILKVLLLGNSHTYYHDLPQTIKEITASSGFTDSILIVVVAPGGYSLQEHSISQQTLDAVQQENWDWVILQENASLAALPTNEAAASFYPFVSTLKNLVRANNKETELLLYMTHAYKDGALDCSAHPTICTYQQMQNQIRRNYIAVGDQVGIRIAPAGIMWKIVLQEIDVILWDTDTIHPSPLGSYISALTIYAMMQDQAIENQVYAPDILDDDSRMLIFQLINQSIFENKPDWRIF